MNITKYRQEQQLELALEGRLDSATAPALEEELRTELDGTELLVLDLSKLEFLSSAGLRLILAAQKRMNRQGRMVLKQVTASVLEIFELTGFVDILTIE